MPVIAVRGEVIIIAVVTVRDAGLFLHLLS
jgi:hypothetical protein